MCEGGTVSRTTYSNLSDFLASLSTPYPYGAGDGSTTFHLPDFRGRTPRGTLTASQVGQTSGAETFTMVTANIPDHAHNITAHTHSNSSMNAESSNHSHTWNYGSGYESAYHTHNTGDHGHTWLAQTDMAGGGTNRATTSSASYWYPFGSGGSNTGNVSADHSHYATMNTTGIYVNHTHSYDTAASSSNTDTGNTTGGAFAGTPVSFTAPFLALRFIIKY